VGQFEFVLKGRGFSRAVTLKINSGFSRCGDVFFKLTHYPLAVFLFIVLPKGDGRFSRFALWNGFGSGQKCRKRSFIFPIVHALTK
jgi:hypothetical protein